MFTFIKVKKELMRWKYTKDVLRQNKKRALVETVINKKEHFEALCFESLSH